VTPTTPEVNESVVPPRLSSNVVASELRYAPEVVFGVARSSRRKKPRIPAKFVIGFSLAVALLKCERSPTMHPQALPPEVETPSSYAQKGFEEYGISR
jgi:hypothetical protein